MTITRTTPQIGYNGNTIVFPHPFSSWEVTPVYEGRENITADGTREAIHLHYRDEGQLFVPGIVDTTFELELRAWYSWAAQRRAFSLAFDSTKTSSTTTTAAVSATATDIPVASAAGLAEGDRLVIHDPVDDDTEEGEIDSIAGLTVTLTQGVRAAYTSGSTVRHRHYWAAVVLADNQIPWVRSGDLGLDLDLRFREDR